MSDCDATSPDDDRSSMRAPRGPQLLRHLVEIELEFALQSLFSARQDLTDLTHTSDDRRGVEHAIDTLGSVTSSVRILLALLRAFGPAAPDASGLFDRGSGAFAVVRRDGEVLYMNAAVSRIVQRDFGQISVTDFEDRTWSDRSQMRRHLEAAHDHGVDEDTFEVVRGDGRTIRMRLHTQRFDVNDEAALLMTFVPERS